MTPHAHGRCSRWGDNRFNDTLIIFSTDNGGAIYGNGSAGGSNWPLRGGKGSIWQGGVRGVSWAAGGWLPPVVRGTSYTGLTAVWDWYATLCELAGVKATDRRAAAALLPPIDSISLAPVLLGTTSSGDGGGGGRSGHRPHRRSLVLGSEPTDGFANGSTVAGFIREENGTIYKLIVGPWDQSCWTGPHFPNRTTNFEVQDFIKNCTTEGSKLGCLFALNEDPEERVDLGALPEQQARVSSMLVEIVAARAQAFNPHRGRPDPRACESALHKWGGFWGWFAP